jgi:oligoendopeptidase F
LPDGQIREVFNFERSIRSQLDSVTEFLNKKERVQNFLYDTMKLNKDSPLVNVF